MGGGVGGGGGGGGGGGLIGPGYTCKCQGQMLGWPLHLHFTQARDERCWAGTLRRSIAANEVVLGWFYFLLKGRRWRSRAVLKGV